MLGKSLPDLEVQMLLPVLEFGKNAKILFVDFFQIPSVIYIFS
jgi:hypothetical protein